MGVPFLLFLAGQPAFKAVGTMAAAFALHAHLARGWTIFLGIGIKSVTATPCIIGARTGPIALGANPVIVLTVSVALKFNDIGRKIRFVRGFFCFLVFLRDFVAEIFGKGGDFVSDCVFDAL